MGLNKKRYLHLKEEADKFRQEGKNFFSSDNVKYIEFLQYGRLFHAHCVWRSRCQYLQILEAVETLNAEDLNVLDLAELIDKFFYLRRSNMRASEKLAKKLNRF
jgi:hypothetical protein